MKQIINLVLFLFIPFAIHAQSLPNSYILFRDAVYLQNKNVLDTMRLYTAAKQDIENMFAGVDKFVALSRCEYLMGITFRVDGRISEAAAFFEQGIAWAEESLEIQPSSEGYRLLGINIIFLSEIRTSYGLKNFGKIEKIAKKAIELDSANLMAQYLLASFYIFAPWPVTDIRKGEVLLREIINQNYVTLDKEDIFNLYLMLQVACVKQKKNADAQIWHDKAMSLYATNNFISMLVK